MLPPPPPPLLLLLLCLHTSLQQTPPPGRCDILQGEDVVTACTSCAAVATARCPHGFRNARGGVSRCNYVVQIGGRDRELPGCQLPCVKTYMQPRCCKDHWGPLCLPCPSWSGKTCNFKGTCLSGDQNNRTCMCDEGFTGFACHECSNPNAYGSNCDQECDCVHGVCNKGPEGDGQCWCQPPYTGRRCDQVSTSCTSCTPYSYCKGEGDDAHCECLPGHRKSSRDTCTSVCTQRDCDVNAECTTQGSKVRCSCKADYEGDGRICVPRNPCSTDNGGCPFNSTVCVFNGPNKSTCKCMFGMTPVNGDAKFGCTLVSACFADTCHHTATCQTGVDGQPRCTCAARQIGDGHRCYGNLMERVLELDRSGAQRENLTGAVDMFERGCAMLLMHSGPFTAFVPLLKTPPSGVNEEVLCKNHLILGQHLYEDLRGQDFTMYGGGRLRTKENKRFILTEDPGRLYAVVQENLPAANGIIHIIDRLITDQPSDRSPRDEQFADKTVGEILSADAKFNRFVSLLDNCGSPPPLRGPGPLTVFVPTNDAVDRARDGSILYMLRNATHKLQELLRNHVFSQASLSVDDLASLPHIHTTANQKIVINTSDTGEILLGEKGVRLATTNIVGSNGIIHMIDGLLYPPSIIPILPHRCDIAGSWVSRSSCTECHILDYIPCRPGAVETARFDCFITQSPPDPSRPPKKGCYRLCNVTTTTEECCKGFYGPDCKPCIGGFEHPCYDKGTCFDGIQGNGSCSCKPGFRGIACHLCSDPAKHGDNCDEECHCVHGVCDNRPGSGGVCRRGSCSEGFSGENCDKRATPCNADGVMEHCHMHAYCTQTGPNNVCACRDGYEGDGHSCAPVNLCLKSDRGGCDTNAECSYAGPGAVRCVCAEGWLGDGRVCMEVNNCLLSTRGGCGENADCKYIGPGQSECVCKSGYTGDGIMCHMMNACSRNNGGCHLLATCAQAIGEAPTCTCAEGFLGDGTICFGSMMDELEMNSDLEAFFTMTRIRPQFSQDFSGNVTLLAPTSAAWTNRSLEDSAFWDLPHRRFHLMRAHVFPGIYSLHDLERLVGEKLPTVEPNTQWEVTNTSGVIKIGDAAIVKHSLPAKNGLIHMIDKVLQPSRASIPAPPPTLASFLNSSSNFTLFRERVQSCNLSRALGSVYFTLLLPTDEAVRQYLSGTNSSVLDCDVSKYHVLETRLVPNNLYDGFLTHTLLGGEYQLHFHMDELNQTLVNDVPLGHAFTEVERGHVIVLPSVLKVRRNRCSNPITLQVKGECSDCAGAPRCLNDAKPVRDQFPANMQPNCRYQKYVGMRPREMLGCVINCVQYTTDHACCPGYYGHECYKCPGEVGSWCSNHGECQDGNLGNGECHCYEGFHGTACEDCEPGRYGVNCTSKCVCNHGKCADGLSGSGKCLCYKGWKGSTCSIEIKDDACGGVCDENANCITGPNGAAAACVCVAGYEGNGTYCKELDVCSRSNGGCSGLATCAKVVAGERTCTCNKGYTGDGIVCLEIDGCLLNNGGCDRNAACMRVGPNRTSCRCLPGYRGSGHYCYESNSCRFNNGGCSRYANCISVSVGQVSCRCFSGYIGNGTTCIGSMDKEISRQADNMMLLRMIRLSDVSVLSSPRLYTAFSPINRVDDDVFNVWKQAGRLHHLAYYHTVCCEKLVLEDLKTIQQVVAMSGHTLQFNLREGSVWVNNMSRIVKSDYSTSNGVIHHVDKLLTPYRLEDQPIITPNAMNLSTAATFYGYTRFKQLLEDAGLLSQLALLVHRPFTMFWPTNEALDSMPAERWRWLTSPDHREQLAATLRGHIIRRYKIRAVSSPSTPSSFRTMHGSTIKYTSDRNLVGNVLINGNAAKVVERYMYFQEGVAFGIDQLLEPPGLGAHCDDFKNTTTYGRCGSCYSPPVCSDSTIDTGRTMRCSSSRYRSSLSAWGDRYASAFGRRNCKRVCLKAAWSEKCCKNHYGRDCQACPGGVEAPCGNHGTCRDGFSESGTCSCFPGFEGRACGACRRGHYGPNCTECNCGTRGTCEDGMEGSGQCACEEGWGGDRCLDRLGATHSDCPRCHADAVCLLQLGCVCRTGFLGDGFNCVPALPPDPCLKYNGGCDINANCTQMGTAVNCTCQSGYQGDGIECEPINRCVEEVNGGCSDFATCTFTGPNERECECQAGYVGNGVQCLEKVTPPVDRCLQDNGDCDPVASCKDLHFHANKAGVFHLRSPEGKYKMNFSQAEAACRAEGATLASFKQLGDAQQLGMHRCVAGWFEGGKVGYPTRYPSRKCGENHVGLVIYKEPVDQSSKFDAYCFRLKDVSCSCPDDYVGDGDFCHGVLTSVLATYQNFSIFYRLLLDYSGSSPAGQQLVEVLSRRQAEVTLFVPHNNGFAQNQTLSARDLEYHVSTNQSSRPYDGLKHQEAIASRLGYNLTVTLSGESAKLVNKRLLVEWDIPAVNGIIHVIEAPLTAPPPPIPHSASRGYTHSTGAASSVLVLLLLVCVLAALGYYVFKRRNNNFRFQYFRNEEPDGSPGGGGSKPSLVSIPNPLYSGSRAFAEPFGDGGQQGVELTEHEEPPHMLDLDQ